MDADTTRDDQIVTRDVAGVVGCEEGDSFGDVCGGSDASEGYAFTPGGDRVLGDTRRRRGCRCPELRSATPISG
jgi:hypothetical protein